MLGQVGPIPQEGLQLSCTGGGQVGGRWGAGESELEHRTWHRQAYTYKGSTFQWYRVNECK